MIKKMAGIELGEENSVSIAEAKNNFAAYISKAAYADEKIIITKRGKPIAAIVAVEDLKKIKSQNENEGLISVVGKWKNFNEIENQIEKIYKDRSREKA